MRKRSKSVQAARTVPLMERDWRAESDLNTLIEAEKIKKDRTRLRAAMARKRDMQRTLLRI